MYPELFTIPILNQPMGSYPFVILVGIVLAMISARHRAKKVGADYDLIPTVFFIVMFVGLLGSRLFYVIHHWSDEFANSSHPLQKALRVSTGGAELYGGVILVLITLGVYFKLHRVSIRLYFDILAPAVMLALGFGRIGCFLYGCCFGGTCANPDGTPALAWAVSFPYGSFAHFKHWDKKQLSVTDQLLFEHDGRAEPLPAKLLELTERQYAKAVQHAGEIPLVTQGAQPTEKQNWASQMKAIDESLRAAAGEDGAYVRLIELRGLAGESRSLPLHPTQLYSAINAFLIAIFLGAVFKRRSRDGVVMGTFLIVYPLSRIVLEVIRVEPRHALGITASTAVSIALLALGGVMLLWLRGRPRQYGKCRSRA
jgi:phosphatidylglycerol:prolipoprotein diacylglycerol transferase